MPVTIREIDEPDVAAVARLDTTFETPTIYEVVLTPRRIELVERRLETPLHKRYPVENAFAPWATWDTAWVADDDGAIVGFASVEWEEWHARLVLHHYYVARTRRREGIGRRLIATVETYAAERNAKYVWLETSNVNVPGIAAYARFGYTLVGFDTTYNANTEVAHEAAVFLAKQLR